MGRFSNINGVQVISSRLLDARRTLVLGLSLIAGLAVEVFPSIAAMAPKPLAPLVGSSLVLSTVLALALNLLFRIGVKKTVRLTIESPPADSQKIEDFLQSNAAKWGARPDVVNRATFAALQLLEAVEENCWRGGPITVEVSFDEFNLDIRVSYQGQALEFPDRRPSIEQIRDGDNGVRLLAGFLLRRNADRVRSDTKDGRALAHFHFDHGSSAPPPSIGAGLGVVNTSVERPESDCATIFRYWQIFVAEVGVCNREAPIITSVRLIGSGARSAIRHRESIGRRQQHRD
jgi:xanthine permease XanP